MSEAAFFVLGLGFLVVWWNCWAYNGIVRDERPQPVKIIRTCVRKHFPTVKEKIGLVK